MYYYGIIMRIFDFIKPYINLIVLTYKLKIVPIWT